MKHDRKKEIFMAAAELFAEKGYSGVSVDEIAQKVGIKASSIYNHYSSKQEIIDSLLDHYLDRMELFYDRLVQTDIDTDDEKDLDKALNKLMLAYEPDEKELMYWLTRITHHEQFTFRKAAEALIGSGYKKYVAAHIQYFDRLSDAGLINGKKHNMYYGELYARLSLTFGTQFLHPEIDPTIENQTELSNFLKKLIVHYEENAINKI